jgi:membrane associated rhomboid family serine protease
LEADQDYVEYLQVLKDEGLVDEPSLELAYLAKRPLLALSISPKSWTVEKGIFSNFLHGSFLHLFLNMIGVVAGVRICTAFIPFLCTFSIFLLGGTFGLWFSSFLNIHSSGDYVPHLGASAGVFALMGTYYVYNFRFRTTYFFWVPSKHGKISLKTSWFFFVDVVLLELLLSTVQFLPQSFDGVDHIAHVGGFFAGVVLAILLRTAQRWPSVLQTRGEFLYWNNFLGPKLKQTAYDPIHASYAGWIELLKINFFNDQLKRKLATHISNHPKSFSPEELKVAFRYFGPTFTRLFPQATAAMIRNLIKSGHSIPEEWLRKSPYDSIIRLAQAIARTKEDQLMVLELILSYQRAQKSNPQLKKKIDLLIEKLQKAQPSQRRASGE